MNELINYISNTSNHNSNFIHGYMETYMNELFRQFLDSAQMKYIYYEPKIPNHLFNYDKTVEELCEKYYYACSIADIKANEEKYHEYARITEELYKESISFKKNGFCDKYQLGRLGEEYI